MPAARACWQAAKRQQQRRAQPEVQQAHAATERNGGLAVGKKAVRWAQKCRHHQQMRRFRPRTWSRSEKIFCSFLRSTRLLRSSSSLLSFHARYCSDDCRQAIATGARSRTQVVVS